MIVVFDIDGVLANFTRGFTSIAAELGLVEEAWDNDQQPTWDFNFHVDPVWAVVNDVPDFWRNLPVLARDQDIEAMWRLHVPILYLTGRRGPTNVVDQTERWLLDHGFPLGEIVLSSGKAGYLAHRKHEVLAVIDDSPHVLADLLAGGFPVTAKRAPYNLGLAMRYVGTVKEFINSL